MDVSDKMTTEWRIEEKEHAAAAPNKLGQEQKEQESKSYKRGAFPIKSSLSVAL
jgi:hypothetical protein